MKFSDEYCDFVTGLVSEKSMKDFESKLNTAGLGMAGEAGEVADVAKKVLFHGMEWNEEVRQKFAKEVSDLLWYIAFASRHVLGMTIEEIVDINVKKLKDRYKSGKFSTEEFMIKEEAKRD